MLAVSESVTETIKQIIQSLQIRFLFPAIVLMVLNIQLLSNIVENDSFLITISVVLIILFSYLFSALNGLIIKLAEGYELSHNPIYSIRKIFQTNRYEKLTRKIDTHTKIINEIGAVYNVLDIDDSLTDEERKTIRNEIDKIKNTLQIELNKLREDKNIRFSDKAIFPTDIGNTIAAFEDYPRTRYGMDSVYLWPRMLLILKDKKFLELVQNEKTTMDFLLNLALVSIVISVELILYNHYYLSLYCFIITIIFYYAANAVAIDWGIMVCTAFDLYRDDLRKALHLPEIPKNSLEQEKEQWQKISKFIMFADADEFEGFDYSRQPQSEMDN